MTQTNIKIAIYNIGESPDNVPPEEQGGNLYSYNFIKYIVENFSEIIMLDSLGNLYKFFFYGTRIGVHVNNDTDIYLLGDSNAGTTSTQFNLYKYGHEAVSNGYIDDFMDLIILLEEGAPGGAPPIPDNNISIDGINVKEYQYSHLIHNINVIPSFGRMFERVDKIKLNNDMMANLSKESVNGVNFIKINGQYINTTELSLTSDVNTLNESSHLTEYKLHLLSQLWKTATTNGVLINAKREDIIGDIIIDGPMPTYIDDFYNISDGKIFGLKDNYTYILYETSGPGGSTQYAKIQYDGTDYYTQLKYENNLKRINLTTSTSSGAVDINKLESFASNIYALTELDGLGTNKIDLFTNITEGDIIGMNNNYQHTVTINSLVTITYNNATYFLQQQPFLYNNRPQLMLSETETDGINKDVFLNYIRKTDNVNQNINQNIDENYFKNSDFYTTNIIDVVTTATENTETNDVDITIDNNIKNTTFKGETITKLKPTDYNIYSDDQKHNIGKNIMKQIMNYVSSDIYIFNINEIDLNFQFTDKTQIRAFPRSPTTTIDSSLLENNHGFSVPEMYNGDIVTINNGAETTTITKIGDNNYTVNDGTTDLLNQIDGSTHTFGSISLTLGSVTGDSDTSGGSSGDPYITSVNNKVTKLPDQHGFYRLFSNDNIFINVEVDYQDITEQMNTYCKTHNLDYSEYQNHEIITKGYWNRTLWISSENNTLTFDLFTKQMTFESDYFKYSVKRNNFAYHELGDKTISKSIVIEWKHSKYGNQSFVVDFYANPQIENGIRFNSNLLFDNKSTGLFVSNYKAKLMKLKNLQDVNDKRLIKNLTKTKNTKETRGIKKNGEIWTR